MEWKSYESRDQRGMAGSVSAGSTAVRDSTNSCRAAEPNMELHVQSDAVVWTATPTD